MYQLIIAAALLCNSQPPNIERFKAQLRADLAAGRVEFERRYPIKDWESVEAGDKAP